MNVNHAAVRQCLKGFDFRTLFREHLGWDNYAAQLDVPIDGTTYSLAAVAEKRGFVAYVCPSIPDRPIRLKIDHQITKTAREHLVVYSDKNAGQQVWQWVRREPGKPLASRDHRLDAAHSGDPLIQRLDKIAVSLDEEEKLTVVDVAGRARAAFDVEKITRQFYDRFQKEHAAFMSLVKGIKEDADLQWYTSLMLNRLMFVYFIQKKGFLDGDTDYLRTRLGRMQQEQGKNKFVTFYRYFLLRLFHEGLGRAERNAELDKLLGKVPYLNGGFFEVHQLEERYKDTDIPDKAFEKLFDFFDQYRWHLDERPLRQDNEINPDVVGYIFEKYINQKQMGAYYTKEDITEYISKNTILPFLFDAAEKKCPIAFRPDSFLWRMLKEDPDRYIYPAVGHGVTCVYDRVNHRDHKPLTKPVALPPEIEAGIRNVAKRDDWNRPAADDVALPTETWREVVARRTWCAELRERLRSGSVTSINDLVTLNLNIWQLARDAIISSEGPELLRAFWQAIEKVTVLDPTCGSGAFLFAALRILQSLYSDCLERMSQFVESLTPSDHAEKFADFKATLAQIAKHPNEDYFVLKSIIINNLFGVDIMEEAVEICKLRLFLKLVAQVETVGQIEPLPDIDFNIRAGNTLVGFSTLDQVRKSMEGMLGFAEKQVERIKEDAIAVECIFKLFREQQTKYGGNVTTKDKQELRRRLAKLDLELDRYLAGEYCVDPEKPKVFEAWRKSHQPFHWFVEFYGIMRDGGFDVVIGNPPYVELKEVSGYQLIGFSCESCGNLYALVMERCFPLCSALGRLGFIVPVSSISTDRYLPLQRLLATRATHYSSYDDRPSRLFDGLEHIRLTIHLIGRAGGPQVLHSTRYNKWSALQRATLFQGLVYTSAKPMLVEGTLPKLCSQIEHGIMEKLRSQAVRLADACDKLAKWPVFYSRKIGYFLQVLDFEPRVLDGKGHRRPPSEFKELRFRSSTAASLALCGLNSSLFYWFITVFSDCRHVNKREVEAFPISLSSLGESKHGRRLESLAQELMQDLRAQSENRKMRFQHDTLTVQCIFPKRSMSIIDEINSELFAFYGFSPEEQDFLASYDLKYRVGADEEAD